MLVRREILVTTEAMVAEIPRKEVPAMADGPIWAEWAVDPYWDRAGNRRIAMSSNMRLPAWRRPPS